MEEVRFNEADHTYWLGDKLLPNVTSLLQKHGLYPTYNGVDPCYAERGKLIHAEIDNYVKHGEIGFTGELQDFIRFVKELGLTGMESEVRLYNKELAGTADLIALEPPCVMCDTDPYIMSLNDHKTGSKIDKEACRWQLTLYRYLYYEMHRRWINRLRVFHLCENSKVIELEPIPDEEVDRLLECERQGILYTPPAIEPSLAMAVYQAEQVIQQIKQQQEEAEANMKALHEKLMETMQKKGIKSFENERMKICVVEPSTRESVDSKKLKDEQPEVYKQYLKTCNVKGSVRITLRG
jgi:hypothetical protein